MNSSFFHHSLSPCARLKPANVNVIDFLHLNTCSAGFRLPVIQKHVFSVPTKNTPSILGFFLSFRKRRMHNCLLIASRVVWISK